MLYLFESTHTVIKAEKLCQNNNIKYKIIPVPRSISPKCGMAIEISDEFEIKINAIFVENKIRYNKYNDYKK